MLTWPVTAIGWIASIIQQAEASQKRINEFLQTEPEITSQSGNGHKISGAIEFKNVSFTYPDTGIRALEKLSFSLQPGEKLAVIGRTGSGKSTIADLLVRMYDVNEGEVLIDGINIRELDLEHLRKRVGYVPQDVFLFSDTIANNIAFGDDDASIEKVTFYAQKAAVYEDIMELPDHFDTRIGERGVTLSGGQKQRLSIARAFIKKPDIVILDDCLSAVDTNTEKQILGYLHETLEDKTSIIITHRIYGLHFDHIIVLDKGSVLEEGTHEELLSKNGFYAKMYERQRLIESENNQR
jgi:ATP-binding cassette subfamily B protein